MPNLVMFSEQRFTRGIEARIGALRHPTPPQHAKTSSATELTLNDQLPLLGRVIVALAWVPVGDPSNWDAPSVLAGAVGIFFLTLHSTPVYVAPNGNRLRIWWSEPDTIHSGSITFFGETNGMGATKMSLTSFIATNCAEEAQKDVNGDLRYDEFNSPQGRAQSSTTDFSSDDTGIEAIWSGGNLLFGAHTHADTVITTSTVSVPTTGGANLSVNTEDASDFIPLSVGWRVVPDKSAAKAQFTTDSATSGVTAAVLLRPNSYV